METYIEIFRKMKIKHLVSACMLLLGLTIHAEDMYLVVELKDNSTYDFVLAEKPIITFESGELVVNGDASTSYVIGNVKNCHFSKEKTSAEAVKVNELRVIYVDDNTIQVQNAVANAQVSVFNVSGAVFSDQKTDENGLVTIQLPNQKGVYVVKINDKSFKVVRR